MTNDEIMTELLEAARAVQSAFDASMLESARIERENDGYPDRRYDEASRASSAAYDEYAETVERLVGDAHGLLRLAGELE